MEVFCWNPTRPAESLDAFNQRLQDYCLANPVLDITPSTAGGAFAVALTDADDAGLDEGLCLIPRIILVPPDQLPNLERFLGTEIEALRERDSDTDPYLPFKATLFDVGGAVLALLLIAGGELSVEPDAGRIDDDTTGAIPPAIRGGKR